MCGITAIFGKNINFNKTMEQLRRINHRGPDQTDVFKNNKCIMCHNRLSIVGNNNGIQPIYSNDGKIVLIANGEIYNYKELILENNLETKYTTTSDCEILIHLYQSHGNDFMAYNLLKGMFAFILYDIEKNIVITGRDHIGMIPLYYGYNTNNNLYFGSEMKTLCDTCNTIKTFPPGNYSIVDLKTNLIDFIEYYNPDWKKCIEYPINSFNQEYFKELLEKVVRNHMNCDVPYGVLLSGGLDSSLIASIVNKYYDKSRFGKLKTFCIGLAGSSDLAAAEKAAEFLGTEHYSFIYELEEGLENIEKTIYHVETYDTTTLRASNAMILMAKRISELGIKMVLTGEVSDEIFGSYAYFKYAPNSKEFYEETSRKIELLNKYDLLRCNKSMMTYGIEARVPFGDIRIVDYVMCLDPKYKMWGNPEINYGIEKYIMRKTFDDKTYLPDEILWRKKEQFSDGVSNPEGKSWINSIKEYSTEFIKDYPEYKYNDCVVLPDTDEEKMNRIIFEKYYGTEPCLRTLDFVKSVACSTGKALEWMKHLKIKELDPSGRGI